MKIWTWKKIGNSFQDLLFPRLCCVCDRRLYDGEEYLCIRCLMNLPRTNFHLQKENKCEQLFYGRIKPLGRATSYFFYNSESPYKKLIWDFKYHQQPDIGRFVGRIIAKELTRKENSFFNDIDILLPVPLAKEKLASRGYNQCDFIANGIAEITGIPVSRNHIIRTIANKSQTHKNRLERQENVEGIFEARCGEELKGKHVLLIDDVLTTGATLVACGAALQKIKDIRISFLTMACVQN